ncbi:MAG: hypothetical protein LBG06_05385 [Deltaproteobacteria bacterium]|nr:hypothetical protein [Deltaproteobacteria bacterium]
MPETAATIMSVTAPESPSSSPFPSRSTLASRYLSAAVSPRAPLKSLMKRRLIDRRRSRGMTSPAPLSWK